MGGWRLTVRHGSRVDRESFDSLDAAAVAMERAVEQVRGAGPLDEVSMLRTYGPGERIAARVELSSGGWLRRREAGVDVMGDGALVAYSGGVGRRRLESLPGESELDAVRRELSG
jgi:hypothetical protein